MKSSVLVPAPLKWIPSFLTEARDAYRQGGFRGVLKRYGWKMLAALFVYYLVRDVTIYILIPWFVAKRFL